MSELRKISPFIAPNLDYSKIEDNVPELVWIDPCEVWIDETYQRNISSRGKALIFKIIKTFNYKNYKPPILIKFERGYKAIDGQHTLIAAATHPFITKVPCLVFDRGLDAIEDQALAFVAHNSNRTAVSTLRIFKARLAAKDSVALALNEMCDKCGVSIVYSYTAVFSKGETQAIAALERLYKRLTPVQMELLLTVCANSNVCPITNSLLLVVEHMLWKMKDISPYDLESALRKMVVDEGQKFSVSTRSQAIIDLSKKIIRYMKEPVYG